MEQAKFSFPVHFCEGRGWFSWFGEKATTTKRMRRHAWVRTTIQISSPGSKLGDPPPLSQFILVIVVELTRDTNWITWMRMHVGVGHTGNERPLTCTGTQHTHGTSKHTSTRPALLNLTSFCMQVHACALTAVSTRSSRSLSRSGSTSTFSRRSRTLTRTLSSWFGFIARAQPSGLKREPNKTSSGGWSGLSLHSFVPGARVVCSMNSWVVHRVHTAVHTRGISVHVVQPDRLHGKDLCR